MRIANNIQSLNVLNRQKINGKNTSKAMEKLSSGLRINKAADDAAGLSISQKMRAQIRGLNQASRNAQDGISLIQTAEGALGEMHSLTQRIRELCVQGANGTLTDDDRDKIQLELDELKSEMNKIATNTEFNTKPLLDGSLQVKDIEYIETKVVEEIIIETIYETVVEMEEQTTTNTIVNNYSLNIDLDMGVVGNNESASISAGDDNVNIKFNRVDDTTLNVTIDGNGSNLISNNLQASTEPSTLGEVTYGGTGSDSLYKIIQTADGGYAAVGYSGTANGDIINNDGALDVWVLKLDEDFNKEWSYSLGTSVSDRGYDLVELPGGYIGVVGLTDEVSPFNTESFAAVINYQGNTTIWDRTVGGLKNDAFTSIEIASDGNLLLIGSSRSGDGDLTLGDHPTYFSSVIKIDKDTGDLIDSNWIYPAAGSLTTYNHINDTVAIGNGEFLGVGSFGDVQMIVAFKEDGSKLWTKTYEEGNLHEVGVMSDGSIVALGDYNDGNPLDSMYSRKLYCYDTSGNLKWDKFIDTVGYSEYDVIDGFTITSDDEIFLTYKDDVNKSKNFVFDKDGNQIWSNTVFSTSVYNDLLAISNGTVIQVGTKSSDGLIAGYLPSGLFPNKMIISDVPATFGTQDKNISECIIEFDTSGGGLKAKKIDITVEHDETTVTMVEVEKTVEKQIEKTISKEIEILHSIKEDNGIVIQVGANAGQTLSVSIDDMRPATLGFVDDMPRVNPIEMAGVSLTLSDQVLNKISSQRSKIGAQQNALEHVIKNVDNASEQLQAAESRIADVDMAKELMTLSKFKILEEAANAMLAQSNQLPQGILQLLK